MLTSPLNASLPQAANVSEARRCRLVKQVGAPQFVAAQAEGSPQSAAERKRLAYRLEEAGVQRTPGNPAHHVPLAVLLTGPLTMAVLQQCLAEIVRRHEAPRTSFPAQADCSVQAMRPCLAVDFELTDRSASPPGAKG